jgi:YHS domain-containing protein
MEYVVTSGHPFEEVESLTAAALERQGIVVQRTFSLHSAVQGSTPAIEGTAGNPGYSVLMLYTSGVQRRSLGLLTLYQRGERTVIRPVLAQPMGEDMDADLVAALVLGGIELCAEVAGSRDCVGRTEVAEDEAVLLRDPVCGRRFDHEPPGAAIEHEGVVFYVCGSRCREIFQRDPARYARAGRNSR